MNKLSNDIPESYVIDCNLIPREKENLFTLTAHGVFPTLDRYTILPNEEYEKLISQTGTKKT